MSNEQLAVLRSEVDKLTSPPSSFGTVLQVNEDGTVDIATGNRKLRVAKGAGRPVQEVNRLLEQFQQMRKMTKLLKRM